MEVMETGQDGWSLCAARFALEMMATGPHLMALGRKDLVLAPEMLIVDHTAMQTSPIIKIPGLRPGSLLIKIESLKFKKI